MAGAEIYFVHNDHRGAPIAMTDVNKNVVWRAEYDPEYRKHKAPIRALLVRVCTSRTDHRGSDLNSEVAVEHRLAPEPGLAE